MRVIIYHNNAKTSNVWYYYVIFVLYDNKTGKATIIIETIWLWCWNNCSCKQESALPNDFPSQTQWHTPGSLLTIQSKKHSLTTRHCTNNKSLNLSQNNVFLPVNLTLRIWYFVSTTYIIATIAIYKYSKTNHFTI